ncbi:MAG: hypothetical protein WCK93_11395 [Nitrosomonadales bacterium]
MSDFSVQQVKIFKKLFAHPPVSAGLGIPEKFILKFVLFEASVRLVGHYYRERTTPQKKTNAHIPLDISVVKRSFAYFGILVADERLALLLGSNLTRRNTKSARNLRNGLAHHWKVEDVKEVTRRYDEIFSALENVIDVIKVRVDCAKK